MEKFIIELLVIMGVITLITSFILTDTKHIRIINIADCLIWIILSGIIGSLWLFIINIILIIIHISHILLDDKLNKNKNKSDLDLYKKYGSINKEEIEKIRHDITKTYNLPYDMLFPYDDDLK